MAVSKTAAACCCALIALCSAQSYTDTHEGSAIEVKTGDLHIDLQDPTAKMYVSVAGGEEIELFGMARRIKELEALVAAQAKDAADDRQATAAKLDAMQKASEASASALAEKAEDIEDALAPEVGALKDGAAKMDTRVAAVETTAGALATLSKEMALVPKMLACSSDAKLYHPEDDTCHPPASSHCDALSTAQMVTDVVAGARLTDAALCLFNKHYGGQVCAASCLPGFRAYFTDTSGAKQYIDAQTTVAATLQCGADAKWTPTFKCEMLACVGKPTVPDATAMTLAVGKGGYGGRPDSVGATYTLACKLADSTLVGAATTSTCVYNEDTASMQWSALAATCPSLGVYTLMENFLGCHKGGKNVGIVGRPSKFLSDFTGVCSGKGSTSRCVQVAKRACSAIREAGDECVGFSFRESWGVQLYNKGALTCTDDPSGLTPNTGWDFYRRDD